LLEKSKVPVMAEFITAFVAAWAVGYVLGFKLKMIRNAMNAV